MAKKKTEKQTIEFKNAGPIEGTFDVTIDGPGLYELRGHSGSGKSTILRGLEFLTGHKIDITLHDGARDGHVKGLGVVGPIGSTKRRRGKIDFQCLDSSRFSLMDVVYPKGATPEVRDGVRLSALAKFTGLTLDAKDFGLRTKDIEDTDDPVLLAARAKRYFDSEAKAIEDEAAKLHAESAALREGVEEVDLDGEHDSSVLADALQAATEKLTQLKEQSDAHAELTKRQTMASEQLEKMTDFRSVDEVNKQLKELSEEEDKIRHRLEVIASEIRLLQREQDASMKQESLVAGMREILETPIPDSPSAEAIETAATNRDKSVAALEEGTRIREALAAIELAEKKESAAEVCEQTAEKVRSKAAGVAGTLASHLQLESCWVDVGMDDVRLVTEYEGREGAVWVDGADGGLSDGERTKLALMEVAARLKSREKPAILPIDQRIYQDLQPAMRKELAAFAKKENLYLFGGQVTDGELQLVKVS